VPANGPAILGELAAAVMSITRGPRFRRLDVPTRAAGAQPANVVVDSGVDASVGNTAILEG
jgi:hypothetical protein